MPLFDRTGPPGGAGPMTGRQMGYRDAIAGQEGRGRREAFGEQYGWISGRISPLYDRTGPPEGTGPMTGRQMGYRNPISTSVDLTPASVVAVAAMGFVLYKIVRNIAKDRNR
jgi:hypothetical protein